MPSNRLTTRSPAQVKLLLTTYFEGVTPNLDTIIALPVQGLHVDLHSWQR
ncbi:5-methyltetrahydropteroyltriglutamate--homocysteine S-methyltransferase [Salmonella enterica subsp. enterica]|uniref:5-methyltetrahydropteroyltriglutamate--homocysteine S-methyltransferase n=1 Tax=Salmonella enterica I TaxID=59201 RepID=A0A379X3H1_SALET|nr:5-methyltetrahydropteroyltriglutamate--homocysteine S-methyltransferase [Salmonella enterica subsp. enterica]